MNTDRLSKMLEDVIDSIEDNQEACKALNLAKDKATEVIASVDSGLLEKHAEYDALMMVKEGLFALNGFPSE